MVTNEMNPPGKVRFFSSSLSKRWRAVRRDLRVLAGGLLGQHPPPLLPRSSPSIPRHAIPASLRAARTLRVRRVVRQTPDAVSVILEDPEGKPLEFLPGQFYTVLAPVGGELLRRAYSPVNDFRQNDHLELAIKRLPRGRVSHWINESLRVGQPLRVLGPSGRFTCVPDPESARRIVLLAGGSGITPLLAIARAILAEEPGSQVALVYGNRGPDDIIYRAELEQLAAQHPTRFVLRHVLSEPPPGWDGGVGILDADNTARELARLKERGWEAAASLAADAPAPGAPAPGAVATHYYLCGPEPMLAAVREALAGRGVEPARIHEERFTQAATPGSAPTRPRPTETLAVTVNGSGTPEGFRVAPGQNLLDAALAAGVTLPYSCTMGGCGACRVQVTRGEVEMEQPNCLTDAEREAGYALTCVGWPVTAVELQRPPPPPGAP
jgi:ferredoxin-NADP reductase